MLFPIGFGTESRSATDPLVKLIVTDWLIEPDAGVAASLSTNREPPLFLTVVVIVMLVSAPNDVSN